MAKQVASAGPRGSARQRRAPQRWLRWGGLAAIALLLTAAAVWWFVGRASNPALYRFDTLDFHAVAFDPTDARTLYFGHHQGMKMSRDGGETWQDTIVRDADVMQIGIPVSDPRRRYLAGHGLFVFSSDGGETWEQPATNLPDYDLHGFAVAPSDPLRVYAFAVGASGLFTSGDGGLTWEQRSLPPGDVAGMLPLAVAPDDPLHLYAAVDDMVAESRDGGQTWQTVPGPKAMITALAASVTTPGVLYAGTDQGIWARSPQGTWERLPLSPAGVVMAVAVSAGAPEQVAVVDQEGYFYRSGDGGRSWGRG
ncbi:MAG: hypothetical protein QJR03_06265 [Sphaerobacter sp.]|nr:hypothetical protein [Sphaerobacter sp.]